MNPPAAAATARSAVPGRRDSLLVFLAVLAACIAATRGIWHGLDGYDFVNRMHQHVVGNPRHPLYLPLATAVVDMLAPFGVSTFRAAVAASSLGTAVGVACMHRAFVVLGRTRRDAWLLTLTIAGCFGVLYYGSVVEIHGVFLAAAGASWWLLARYVVRPGFPAAAAIGVATGLSAAIHATGHMLPLPLVLFALANGAAMDRRRVLHALAAGAVHLVVAVALVRLVLLPFTGVIDQSPLSGPLEYIRFSLSLGTAWWCAPAVAWREWFRPFLPLSVLALVAVANRQVRTTALGLWAVLAVYLTATVILLVPAQIVALPQYLPPFATDECGAYYLPLLLPAAWSALPLLPRRLQPGLPLAAVLWAAVHLVWSDRVPGDLEFARDEAAAIDRLQARLFCGGYDELDGLIQLRPELIGELMQPRLRTVLPVYGMHVYLASNPNQPFAQLTGWFDYQYFETTRLGGSLLVTDAALRLMRATADGLLDRLATEHIPAHYELEPVEQGRFRAWRLRPRGG